MAIEVQGTNIVSADLEGAMRKIEELLKWIEQLMQKEGKDELSKLYKTFREHIMNGGDVVSNTLPPTEAHKVIDALIKNGIPHMAIPDQKGQFFISVRDKDQNKFISIQESVLGMSTEYTKELKVGSIEQIAKDLGSEGVIAFEIEDKDLALIDEQKLFQSGVTFAKVQTENGTKFITSPASAFNENGNDIVKFELMHALEQSKPDSSLETRKEQAIYDDNILTEFAEAVKKGKEVAVCNENKVPRIQATRSGVFFYDKNGKESELLISKNASVSEIKAVVSKCAEEIYNMQIYNGFVDKATVIDPENCERPKFKKKNGEENKAFKVMYENMEQKLLDLNRKVSYEIAKEEAQAPVPHTQKELMEIKRERVAKEIQELIGAKGMDPSIASGLSIIATNFTNRNQGTKTSADFFDVSKKELREMAKAEKDAERAENREQEREQEQESEPEHPDNEDF